MAKKPEWQTIAEAIIESHKGKVYFNFNETSKIIGCGINTVPRLLNEAGILVKKVGTSKRVSAYDIATLMSTNRNAPYR